MILINFSHVLMPCRALEAFRHRDVVIGSERGWVCLNALSGIGGVQTPCKKRYDEIVILGLNALSGIGGVQTK